MYASRTTQFIVGLFGLVGIVALAVLAVKLGRIPLFAPPTYTLYAMFDNVSGLKVNDAVQIAGVKVGKVVAITLSQKDERARVTLQITQGVAVDDDAVASIKTNGIIGDKYISLSIGGGEELKDGGLVKKTESSFVLEDAIAQLMGNSGGKNPIAPAPESNQNGSGANATGANPSGAAPCPCAPNQNSGSAIGPPPGLGTPNKPESKKK
jgi:phospholipid/cholesterol/gamma-HCH transport system substrate-binding protein